MKSLYLYLCPALAAMTLVTAAPVLESTRLSKRQDDCGQLSYIDVMLQSFNVHRANHSAPALVWNQTLADAAQYTVVNGELGVHDK